MKIRWGRLFLAWSVVVASTAVSTTAEEPPQTMRRRRAGSAARVQTAATLAPPANPVVPSKAFVDSYCATCHNQRLNTAGLAFDTLDVTNVAAHAPTWEKV